MYFYIFLLISSTSYVFLLTTLRKKFLYFVLLVLFFSFLGFLLDLDGMMLVFLTTEFTIVLLFLMTYLQLYSNFSFNVNYFSLKPLIFLIFIFFFSLDKNFFFFYSSYYKQIQHIVSSDFFILYYVLFINLSIIVVIITLILSLFSLFFILLYFNLKALKNTFSKEKEVLHFLRKQNLIKQTNFKVIINSFQH